MAWDIVVLALVIVIAVWIFYTYSWTFYLFLATIGAIIVYLFFIKKYDEFERGIIFRMGKFNRVVGPGWVFVIPFFEKEYARVDARTQMVEINVDDAFTRDDLRLDLNGVFYYKITNPEKAILNIKDYEKGIKNMVASEMRNVIGNMYMRELFANLDKLNNILKDKVRHNSWKWGIDISMVQLRSISPPVEIAEALEKKEIAAQELQAQRFVAEAKAVTLSALGKVAKNMDEKTLTYLYIQALKELGKGQGKIIFPAKFMNIVDSVGDTLKNSTLKGVDTAQLVEQIKKKIMEGQK